MQQKYHVRFGKNKNHGLKMDKKHVEIKNVEKYF